MFRGYIDLEIQLREFDRCRTLYEKFLIFGEENCTTWMKFAELETLLGDIERARGIYELAIKQPRLDMPEILWKVCFTLLLQRMIITSFIIEQAYVDFEIDQGEFDKARALYERLLERTQHVKVWMSFAQFELTLAASQQEESSVAVATARAVYQRANRYHFIAILIENELNFNATIDRSLRSAAQQVGIDVAANKEERLMLLEAWRDFELQYGDDSSRHAVNNLLPKRVKKRRRIQTQDGVGLSNQSPFAVSYFCFLQSDAGWEEFFDYIFPEDEASKPNLKLLAMAKAWKKGVDTTLVQEQAPDTNKDANNERDRDQPDDPNSQDDRDDSSDSSGSDSEED